MQDRGRHRGLLTTQLISFAIIISPLSVIFPFLLLRAKPGLIWEAEPYMERADQMNM